MSSATNRRMRATVVVTDRQSAEDIVAIGDNGSLEIRGSSPLAGELGVGSIIASAPNDRFPDGFLRVVTAIASQDGQLSLATAPAALTDAIKSCDIDTVIAVDLARIESLVVMPGVELVPPVEFGTEFDFDLDLVVHDEDGDYETEGDQVRVRGDIALGANIELAMVIRNSRIQEFSYILSREQELDLEVSIASDIEILDRELVLATFRGPAMVVQAGPLPIVVKPRFEIILDVRVDGSASIVYGYHLETNTRSGSRYRNGTWNDISSDTRSIQHLEPSITGAITARAEAAVKTSLMVYGVLGPYIKNASFVEAIAEGETVDDDLHVTAEVAVGANAALGFNLAVFSHSFIHHEASWDVYRIVMWEDEWIIYGDGEVVWQPGPIDGLDVWITNFYSYGSDYGVDDFKLRVGGWADYYNTLLRFELEDLPDQASRPPDYTATHYLHEVLGEVRYLVGLEGCDVVPVEVVTWSGVKALYR